MGIQKGDSIQQLRNVDPNNVDKHYGPPKHPEEYKIGQLAFNENGDVEGDSRVSMYFRGQGDKGPEWKKVVSEKDSVDEHTVLKVQKVKLDSGQATIDEAEALWRGKGGKVFGNVVIGYYRNNTYIIATTDNSGNPKSEVINSFITNPTKDTDYSWLKLSNTETTTTKVQHDAPANPSTGDLWLSLETAKLSIWSGNEWLCNPGPKGERGEKGESGDTTRLDSLEKRIEKLELKGGTS